MIIKFILFFFKDSLFLAVLGRRCSVALSLVVVNVGYSLVAVCGLLTAVDFLLWSTGSRVHRLQ